MAGMPVELIDRANEILKILEERSTDNSRQTTEENQQSNNKTSNTKHQTPNIENLNEKVKGLGNPKMQLSIFDAHSQTFDDIRKMLAIIDINRLTPVEALMKLNEIKEMIK
jgi:DNA mismatch repair protein MutS